MTASSNQRRVTQEEATFPPNRILRWPRTDAKGRERFPTNTTESYDANGVLNYLKLLDPLDADHFNWRKKVGTDLAKTVDKLPDVEGGYIIDDFPQGYEFYDHHKGQGGGKIRHDVYLFGPENVSGRSVWRFRSVPEFIPHARWLYDTDSKAMCQCKYCNGLKYQKEITATLDIDHLIKKGGRSSFSKPYLKGPRQSSQHRDPPRKSGASPAASRRRKRTPSPKRSRLSSRSKPPAPDVSVVVHSEYVHKDRAFDLETRKPYRREEVVWAKVDPPLVPSDQSTPDEAIHWWPAMVFSQELRIDTQDQHRVEVPYYEIQYFGAFQQNLLMEDDILPFHTYRPPPALLARMQHYRLPPGTTFDEAANAWHVFRPLALTPYELPGEHPEPSYQDALPSLFAAARASDTLLSFYQAEHLWKCVDESDEDEAKSEDIPSGPMEWHGLWWGCERIWVGDLVRLKCVRDDLPPSIQTGLRDVLPESLTIGRSGLFLLLDCIRTDDSVDHDDFASSTTVSGSLWQAVANEWENSDEEAQQKVDSISHMHIKTSVRRTTPSGNIVVQYLPEPPARSKWRMVSMPGAPLQMPVLMIAGRYYPRIIEHPVVGVPPPMLDQLLAPISTDEPMEPGSEPWSHFKIQLALGGFGRAYFENKDLAVRRTEDRREALIAASEIAEKAVWEMYSSFASISRQVA
ncbi:hypothetical protein DL93DRAFT_2164934 [Clavulina sp. PMI_390]|nr:hypothetical protein DL93DRAFT_2164934 [Clavulina sp. PMI_390]